MATVIDPNIRAEKLKNQRLSMKLIKRDNEIARLKKQIEHVPIDASGSFKKCIEQLTDGLTCEGRFDDDPWLPNILTIEVDDQVTMLPMEIDFELSHMGWECKVTATLDEFSYSSGYATWEISYGIFNKEC